MAKGGSQGAGKVEYPAYMEAQHEDWLDDAETLINPYITGDSPYVGEAAYNPDTQLSQMETDLNSYKDYIDSNVPATRWFKFVSDVLISRDEVFTGIDTDVQTIDTYVQGQVTTYIDDILSGNAWEDLMSRVKSELELLKSDAESNALSVIESSKSIGVEQILDADSSLSGMLQLRIANMIIEALNATYSAGIDSIIDDEVEAFESSAEPELARSMSRFTAGMVDIGAVHTGSFIFGMAAIEDGFQRDLKKRRAEIKDRMIQSAMQGYLSTYTQILTEYVRSSLGSSKDYQSLYSNNLQVYSSFLSDGVKTILSKLQTEIASKMQMYSTGYQNYMNAFVQDEKGKSIFVSESIGRLAQLLAVHDQANANATQLAFSLYSTWISQKKNQSDKDIDMDTLDALWPMQILNQGGNVLASIAGAASTVNRVDTAPDPLSVMSSGIFAPGFFSSIMKGVKDIF